MMISFILVNLMWDLGGDIVWRNQILIPQRGQEVEEEMFQILTKINGVLTQPSFFSEIKAEGKNKKRKLAETVGGKKEKSYQQANESNDVTEEEPGKEDDVDPLAEGWEASDILGATDVEGKVHFLIKW